MTTATTTGTTVLTEAATVAARAEALAQYAEITAVTYVKGDLIEAIGQTWLKRNRSVQVHDLYVMETM